MPLKRHVRFGSNHKTEKDKAFRSSRMQSLHAERKQILLETMPIQPMETTTNRIGVQALTRCCGPSRIEEILESVL